MRAGTSLRSFRSWVGTARRASGPRIGWLRRHIDRFALTNAARGDRHARGLLLRGQGHRRPRHHPVRVRVASRSSYSPTSADHDGLGSPPTSSWRRPACPDRAGNPLLAGTMARRGGACSDAGGGSRAPDTRIMIGDSQGSEGSERPSQAREGAVSSGESRELGAQSGARSRRKRKRRRTE
jgi:hypothetical protein